tara:strand:+ start:6981 stop:7448 length:468 start_codon:yes stop_codon:yes gene_type:complete
LIADKKSNLQAKVRNPLAKIIALDIGGKRTGIAETDFLKIVASPLETIATENLLEKLKKMWEAEKFEAIIIGEPIGLDGGDSDNSERVRDFRRQIEKQFPNIIVDLQDERFTSKMAKDLMISGGMKKKQRRQKGEIDKISAAVILQAYLSRGSGY